MAQPRKLPFEKKHASIQQFNSQPFGLRIHLRGQWDIKRYEEYIKRHSEKIRALLRTYLFVLLRPSHYRNTRLRKSWGVLDSRDTYEDVCMWHEHGRDKTIALLCPEQETTVLPTGFADTASVIRATQQHARRLMSTTRNGRGVLQQFCANISKKTRSETVCDFLDDFYQEETDKDHKDHIDLSHQLIGRVNNTLGKKGAVYWHHWKPGDCVLFEDEVLHVRQVVQPDDDFDVHGGGTLYHNVTRSLS